jgi:hypothetical protein
VLLLSMTRARLCRRVLTSALPTPSRTSLPFAKPVPRLLVASPNTSLLAALEAGSVRQLQAQLAIPPAVRSARTRRRLATPRPRVILPRHRVWLSPVLVSCRRLLGSPQRVRHLLRHHQHTLLPLLRMARHLPRRHRTRQLRQGSHRRRRTTVLLHPVSARLHRPLAQPRLATARQALLLVVLAGICHPLLLPHLSTRLLRLGGLLRAPRRILLHLPTLPARRRHLEDQRLLATARRRRLSALHLHASEILRWLLCSFLTFAVSLYYHLPPRRPLRGTKEKNILHCMLRNWLVISCRIWGACSLSLSPIRF